MTQDLTGVLRMLMARFAPDPLSSAVPSNSLERELDDEEFGESVWRQALWNLVLDERATPFDGDRALPVADVVSQITDALARQLPERLKLTLEYSGLQEGQRIAGDREALEELVVLQVARAVHGIGADAGRVVVRLEQVDDAEARTDCPQIGAGPHLRILLETFGAGEPTRNGLDPLFRAPGASADSLDRARGSWSVGWALARRAAARLGGVLCHAPDRASCKAYLPVEQRARKGGSPLPLLESEACGPEVGLDLVFACREDPILAMGRPALVHSDCSVRVVDRRDDTLDLLRSRSGELHAVVIADDLVDADATQLFDEARAIVAHLPILVGAGASVELREHVLTPRFVPSKAGVALERSAASTPTDSHAR